VSAPRSLRTVSKMSVVPHTFAFQGGSYTRFIERDGFMNKKTYCAIKMSRAVHLVDIENICGASELTPELVTEARETYFERVRPAADDLFYVTASPNNKAAVCFGWPQAHHEFLAGKDGGDILLAKAIVVDHIQEAFCAVYVASGDGGLMPFVDYLIHNQVPVTIVSGMRQLAMSMRLVGAPVVYIDSRYHLAA
jgi:hypothetical protein